MDFMLHAKHKVAWKFAMVMTIFLAYFFFVYFQFNDAKSALSVVWLSWSAFVLCTPVADAGFLIDFPLRLLLKIKMFISELLVWFFALFLNLYFILTNPEIYQSTKLLSIAYEIYTNPYPFWLIIFLSALGTFLSVYFADDLLDNCCKSKAYKKHHVKFKIILFIFIFSFVFLLYEILLESFNISF